MGIGGLLWTAYCGADRQAKVGWRRQPAPSMSLKVRSPFPHERLVAFPCVVRGEQREENALPPECLSQWGAPRKRRPYRDDAPIKTGSRFPGE